MKLVAITGFDGAGKSSLIKSLLEGHSNMAEVSIWDALDGSIFTSKKEVDTYLTKLSGEARTLFLAHALSEAVNRGLKKDVDVLLLNGYYFKYFCSELALGAPSELINMLIPLFPKPDLTIFLDIPFTISAQRKARFSQYECGLQGPSEDNFLKFQKEIRRYVDYFPKDDWMILDASKSQETIIELTENQLNQL